MIRLSNLEVSAFLNPTIGKLFDDINRTFPTEDAFILADLTSQIQQKGKIYQDQVRKLIMAKGGLIHPDGRIQYEDLEKQLLVQKEIDKLNMVIVEIIGSRVTWKDSWPKLSVNEAYILRPLIKSD